MDKYKKLWGDEGKIKEGDILIILWDVELGDNNIYVDFKKLLEDGKVKNMIEIWEYDMRIGLLKSYKGLVDLFGVKISEEIYLELFNVVKGGSFGSGGICGRSEERV